MLYHPAQHGTLTSVQAEQLLRKELPHIPRWLAWKDSWNIRRLVGPSFADTGAFRGWTWRRLPNAYSMLTGWSTGKCDWTGLVEVTAPAGLTFLVFSYLCADEMFGCDYGFLVSTDDTALLGQMGQELSAHARQADRAGRDIVIHMVNGRNITLARDVVEPVCLPAGMAEDILEQGALFFEQSDLFRELKVPHRRGLLFVGPPGNGKSMMVRELIRTCCRKHDVRVLSMAFRTQMDEDVLMALFDRAKEEAPSIVVLEEIDSLLTDVHIPRGAVLSLLDGLDAPKQVLVLATSNNPERIDMALLHRPSRFDRVWVFPLPDLTQRQRFLMDRFAFLAEADALRLARATANWSYAYLNELRTSASLLAAYAGRDRPDRDLVDAAFDLLAAQFTSGRKGHSADGAQSDVGFGADRGSTGSPRRVWPAAAVKLDPD